MTLFSPYTVCQGEAGCGAGVGGRQYLRGIAAVVSPHQQEASRRSPARVDTPPLLELVTLLPALASQGDAAGDATYSTAGHLPVLSVATPEGGERGHCAGEGDTRGGEHLH